MHDYFVGLDVPKQVIAYCVKKVDGEIVSEGNVKARRAALSEWVKTLPGPWRAQHKRRAACAVRQYDQRKLAGCGSGVGSGRAYRKQGRIRRTQPLRLLDRCGLGWVPDRR